MSNFLKQINEFNESDLNHSYQDMNLYEKVQLKNNDKFLGDIVVF